MNIIFISPNYPAGHKRYVAALRGAGHNVLGLGDAGDETFPADLRGGLTAYYRVGDLHDYAAVRRACCYYIWQYGSIDAVESLNPYWRDLVDALRGEFCLPAGDPAREYTRLARLSAVAPGLSPRLLTSNAKKACDFAAVNGYPLLATPVGNKRLGTRLLVADAGVKALLRGGTKDEYCFALCPEGEKLTVDGLVLSGDLVACAAHGWSEDGQSLLCVPLKGLEERCAALAAEFSLTDGFFHCDAVRLTAALPGVGKKGEVIFVAFEPTPPHEYLVDLLDAEFGCDLRESWATGRVVLRQAEPCVGWSESAGGAAVSAPAETADMPEEEIVPDAPALPLARGGLGAAACRSFSRSYRTLHERILRRLTVRLSAHGRTAEPDRALFGDYVYIFTAENAAELKRTVRLITEDYPPKKPAEPPKSAKPDGSVG